MRFQIQMSATVLMRLIICHSWMTSLFETRIKLKQFVFMAHNRKQRECRHQLKLTATQIDELERFQCAVERRLTRIIDDDYADDDDEKFH